MSAAKVPIRIPGSEAVLMPHHGVVERRSWPLLSLAFLAGVGTLWYLAPFGVNLIGNYVVAIVVLALPLWRWLPARRYGRIAAVWIVAGLAGAYFFGTLVFAVGLVSALGLAVDAGLRRSCLRAL